MRTWYPIVRFRQQPSQDRPQSKRLKHPARNILHLRFLNFLVGPVRKIDAIRVGQGK